MLSTAINAEPPAELLRSVSDLARERGRDKALISRQVARLVDAGKLRTYPGARGAKLVNVVEFDRAIGETGDGIKTLAAATARSFREDGAGDGNLPLPPPAEESAAADPPATLAAVQRRKIVLEAARLQLDIQERLGKVMPRELVVDGTRKLIDTILREMEQLPLIDEEIASAARDGRAAIRTVLKRKVFEIRSALASASRDLETEGKAQLADGPIEVEFDEVEPTT